MDVTIINHTNWEKSLRYWVDPVVDTKDIETYHFANVPYEKIEQIKNTVYTKVQDLLKSL